MPARDPRSSKRSEIPAYEILFLLGENFVTEARLSEVLVRLGKMIVEQHEDKTRRYR